MRKSKRYRYYVCCNAQQQGWQNCETKSVSAQAIEIAVLDSIRRIGTDPKQIARQWPGVPAGEASFGTIRCAHLKHVRFYKLDLKLSTMLVGRFR